MKIEEKRAKVILKCGDRFWSKNATIITDEAVEIFAENPEYFFSDMDVDGPQVVEGYFDFGKLKELSEPMAELLSKYQGEIEFSFGKSLTEFSESVAKCLGETKGTIKFEGPINLPDGAWEALSKHEGILNLNYQEKLSDAALISLSKHRGELGLTSLEDISETAALAIKERADPIDGMSPTEFLSQWDF
tara:strand:- start:2557 stop:3126 length:570 start_codon:yes stop_codon:yes gene_type:complete